MPPPEDRPLRLLVSFSPSDQELKDHIVLHLQVLVRFAGIELWTSDRVRAGDDWRQEVDAALDRADVALLLISADFLASDFLQDVEVPKLFKRRETGGLRVVPVLLRSCHWEAVPWLQTLSMLPREGRAVASFAGDAQDVVLTEVAKQVVGPALLVPARNRVPTPPLPCSTLPADAGGEEFFAEGDSPHARTNGTVSIPAETAAAVLPGTRGNPSTKITTAGMNPVVPRTLFGRLWQGLKTLVRFIGAIITISILSLCAPGFLNEFSPHPCPVPARRPPLSSKDGSALCSDAHFGHSLCMDGPVRVSGGCAGSSMFGTWTATNPDGSVVWTGTYAGSGLPFGTFHERDGANEATSKFAFGGDMVETIERQQGKVTRRRERCQNGSWKIIYDPDGPQKKVRIENDEGRTLAEDDREDLCPR